MRILLTAALAAIPVLSWAAQAVWQPLATPAPGATAIFYSPTTARLENDRGNAVRAVDVKYVAADGREHLETWKVSVASCAGRLVDVSIFENGKFTAMQRSLSTVNFQLDSTRMARAACGLPQEIAPGV